jgi:AcrR family transcriptional regulator
MRQSSQDSRERILEAAITVFSERGKSGARMEDIGERAGINKAMVYYYYSSREILYGQAIEQIVRRAYTGIHEGLAPVGNGAGRQAPARPQAPTQVSTGAGHGAGSDQTEVHEDPIEMLERFVRLHFEAYSHDPAAAQLLLDALTHNPELVKRALKQALSERGTPHLQRLYDALERGKQEGVFREVDIDHLLISAIGMNLIHFLAKPMAEVLLDVPVGDHSTFSDRRLRNILNLILYGALTDKGRAQARQGAPWDKPVESG